MALIELKNISKYYGGGENKTCALSDVSLKINRGEFIAIAGPSGSGKSTLMNMLGCLDIQSRGEYRLGGADVAKLSDKKLSKIRNREIGFIFQSFNLIPNLTAWENVELPLIYRGINSTVRKELSLNALERVSLKNRINHRPSQMSGGQQQRVAIARAIAASPPIILADEPTGNLDSKCGADVMQILYELNAQGKTIIIITHDDKIAALAARTIRVTDGRIVSDITAKSS
ncbi:MAG: ABC transporter ATP-binding protein [Oscillospiraceae bacterium]|nr:ABC transporter ATP-binding protein [Oscillospiraceae bacterium]